ncbi:hypothetical protein, partial [Bacteroides sp. HMSC068A09]|uniref:hypothetical protein n=1 Tax=Bacteroides sp. HMSC068A09 TaxID=1739319 RepID=UPI001AEFB6A2
MDVCCYHYLSKGFAKTSKPDNGTTASMPILYPVGSPHHPHTPQPSDRKAKCRDACCTTLAKSYLLFFIKHINKETLC